MLRAFLIIRAPALHFICEEAENETLRTVREDSALQIESEKN